MEKLLVATDFSELARHAYVAATSLAKAYDAGVQLVHQAEPLPFLYKDGSRAPIPLDSYYDQLNARLNEELEMNLPLNKIFELPTISQYAKHIEGTILMLLEE